jgi:hypothetical protein
MEVTKLFRYWRAKYIILLQIFILLLDIGSSITVVVVVVAVVRRGAIFPLIIVRHCISILTTTLTNGKITNDDDGQPSFLRLDYE